MPHSAYADFSIDFHIELLCQIRRKPPLFTELT